MDINIQVVVATIMMKQDTNSNISKEYKNNDIQHQNSEHPRNGSTDWLVQLD